VKPAKSRPKRQEWPPIKKTIKRGKVQWCVDLGKLHSGKRERHFFDREKTAKDFAESKRAERYEKGRSAALMPDALRVEALACHELLKGTGATLRQCVDYWLKREGNRQAILFSELCKEFLASRRAMQCKPKTMVQYESYTNVIKQEFEEEKTTDIDRSDIEDWLLESKWSPRTRKNYLVTLTTIFNYAKNKGYVAENPAEGIERPILDDKPPGILTVAQVRSLFWAANEHDKALLPTLAIALFAGLRRSELCALNWDEVDLESGLIEVKAAKAKTRKRRLITIQPNLLKFLNSWERKGEIGPRNPDLFNQRLNDLLPHTGTEADLSEEQKAEAKISKWPHNALRHSYGTYHLAKFKNENQTALEMGNSPQIVMSHYREIVRPKAADLFWEIAPTIN